MSIDITPAPILNLNINHPNCGMNDGSIEAIVTSGTPPITYDWLGGPSTPLWSGLGTGFYQLTISDTIGCTIDTLVELINPGAPTLSILNFQDTECGIPTGEITVGATGGTSPYTFDIGGGPQASGTFTGLNSGNYTITVEDAMGCQSNINFTISDTSTLAGVIINVVNEPCGSGQGELEVQATGGASPFTYDIGGGPQPTGLFTGLTTGWHTVTITDLGGCSYDVPVFVDEDPLDVDLGPDIITCDDDSLIVNAPGPYLWSTGATTQGIEVTVGGMYWVEVGSAPCTAYDTIVVTMLSGGTPPVLPNVFTPNGDGDNDLFNFVLPPFVENYRLRIYDIWGLLMFETTDKGNGWDGKDMGGTDVPDGTYFWTLEYVDPCVGPSIITHSGYVALFR